ncbi:MAG: hypothetical protein QME96_08095, partial [Myxococcota bacterium]|nr:hypothetical protein [Myxococcota bacterium]
MIRCPICGEAAWTDQSRCGACGVRFGDSVGAAPARDSETRESLDAGVREATGSAADARVAGAPLPMLGRDALLDRAARHLRSGLSAGR